MQLSLILLRQPNLTLIAQTDEMPAEPRVHLVQPYVVGGKTKLTLTRWPDYTDDIDILLHSDSLLTVCDPTEDLAKLYLKKIGKSVEDINKDPDRVLLNEGENILDPLTSPMYNDEYEPRYIETDDF